MSKRQAYLVMAYTNWEQLKILFGLLDDVENDILLHVNRLVECPNSDYLMSAQQL